MAEPLPPQSRPSTSLGASGGRRLGASGGRRRAPIWILGGGLAAAALLVYLQPFTAGVEPSLLRPVELSPLADGRSHPLRPDAVKLDVSATLRFGRLLLRASRAPTDVYAAVALVDAQGRWWVVQSGVRLDPACAPACGPLKLRVELDPLAPGAFTATILVSPRAIEASDVQAWLRALDQPPSGWLGVSGYAVARVAR